MSENIKVLAQNKQAYYMYFIEEKFEVGLQLAGTEVKSIRQGKVNLKDSWCSIHDGEAFVRGMHISPYEKGNIFNKDPLRERKLLLHKSEIMRLMGAVQKDGYSLVPLSVYLKGSLVKLQLAIAKGKKLHDKRDSEAERDAKRDIDRAIKDRNQ